MCASTRRAFNLGVRRAYHNRYKHSLEEDVAAHTTGHVRQASLSP